MKIDYPHRSKFVKILEESLRLNGQKFAEENVISVELPSGGYPGEVTVIIEEGDKENFDTDWTGSDSSRFVTKDKQKALTQYNDFIDGDLLFWEGEEKHGTDQRIINATKIADDIHLFYREIHHSPFEYYGLVNLLDYQINKVEASEFIFKIVGARHQPDVLEDIEDHNVEFKVLKKTEQESIVKSRIGQGDFRKNLIKIWGKCAVTGVKKISILKASHIKPWRVATNQERVDPYNGLLLVPNLDELFDAGIISFAGDGSIMISRFISSKDLELLNIHDKLRLRKMQPANEFYLKYHRQNIFEK